MSNDNVSDTPKRRLCILPIAIDGHHEFDHRAILESWGLEFLETFGEDNKLQYVRLPENWIFVAVDPDKHFKVVDDKGRDRINAFLDDSCPPSPFIRLCHRITIQIDHNKMVEDNLYVANVYDSEGKLLHTTDPIVGYEDESDDVKVRAALKRACDWLKENYPDWRNPAAYWE